MLILTVVRQTFIKLQHVIDILMWTLAVHNKLLQALKWIVEWKKKVWHKQL